MRSRIDITSNVRFNGLTRSNRYGGMGYTDRCRHALRLTLNAKTRFLRLCEVY
jgi:hypothetical protein